MNILVYAGRGVSQESLHHTLHSLKRSLGSFYDIQAVTSDMLTKDPWEVTCSLLVFPGGRDLPYVEELSGRATSRIRQYVKQGGKYLGICAGTYFASRRVEFELGTKLEVCGDRELALCPAIARGTVYPGFEYSSEVGAKAAPIIGDDIVSSCKIYYNGGCYFDGIYNDDTSDIELLWKVTGWYGDYPDKPAIVLGYREGSPASVILSGVHIEYDLDQVTVRQPNLPILNELLSASEGRINLWQKILASFALRNSSDKEDADEKLYELTPLYFYFPDAKKRSAFMTNLTKQKSFSDSILKCENTQFAIHEDLHTTGKGVTEDAYPLIITNKTTEVTSQWTFSPDQYYKHIANRNDYIGQHLIYTEVIGSTQTILSTNPLLTSILLNGTVLLAGTQIAGRGRGKNQWLSSPGCLQFTMLLHHRDASTLTLIQYLTGLALVEAVLSEPGYEKLPLRLKWPNDLYSEVGPQKDLKKLGGILVNSQTFGDDGFLLLIGMGVNVYDTPWTRSLNDVISLHNDENGSTLLPWSKEQLLARFVSKFSDLYRLMLIEGFPFALYHRRWLHSGQVVFLEEEQKRVRIEGIDKNGFMIARPHTDGLLALLDAHSLLANEASQPFLLQPDGNSFDMMKGLIKRK